LREGLSVGAFQANCRDEVKDACRIRCYYRSEPEILS